MITNFDKLFSRSCINAKTFYSTAEKNSGMGLAIALERKNRREISGETGLGTAGWGLEIIVGGGIPVLKTCYVTNDATT